MSDEREVPLEHEARFSPEPTVTDLVRAVMYRPVGWRGWLWRVRRWWLR